MFYYRISIIYKLYSSTLFKLFFTIFLLFIIYFSPSFAATNSPLIHHGKFEITSAGFKTISGVGFEPDVIKFEITSTNENFNTQTIYNGKKFGWGHGFSNIHDNGTVDNIALTVASGSDSTNGMAAASSDQYSIFQVLTPDDGDAITGWIEADVSSTNSDGFTINVNKIDNNDNQFVTYTAYKFENSSQIDVGFFNTSTTTGLQSIDLGFEPTFLNLITQSHRSIDDINTQIQDSQGDNGWGHGYATQRGGFVEQLSMAISMHSENIDYHSWGSSNEHILYTLEMKPKTSSITGRIKAKLESFDNTGFTLNYDEVAGGQIAIYMAIDTKFDAEVDYFETPLSTGSQIIPTNIDMESISFIGSNTIESINSEALVTANHHGWMFGSGNTSYQQSMGFSSNSDSVNAHASRSSITQAIDFLYTDQDANILGRDSSSITDITSNSFELNWNSITTSGINYDSVLMGYYGFASSPNFIPQNERINISKKDISINESILINTTITDKNGNSTISNVNVTIQGPNSTQFNPELIPEKIDKTTTSGDVETDSENYTAVNNGETIGESGKITLQNRESKLIQFTQTYNQTPVILSIATSQNNDESPYIPVIHSINTTHANISLCRDNGNSTCDNSYTAETVHYAIFDIDKANNYSWIDVGRFNRTTDGTQSTISFSNTFSNTPYVFGSAQSYNINSVTTNGIGAMTWFPSTTTSQTDVIACDHPGTANDCAGTATEEFGFVAIDTTNENITDLTSGSKIIEDSAWTSVSYGKSYTDPIILVNVNSEAGPEDPKYPWARNVLSSGTDIRYCEADAANTCDTHNGETTRWLSFEKGPIRIGAGGQDVEREALIKTYNNVFLDNTFNITQLLFEVGISQYDNSGSQARGNKDPDLRLEVNTNSGWVSIGALSTNSVGTYSINVTNTSILNSWNTITNRDIRIFGIDFDHFDDSTKDRIIYDSLSVDVKYKDLTSIWTYNFTNTSQCGLYNLTQLWSQDKRGGINQTILTNKTFIVSPCPPKITLLDPINNSKLLTRNTVEFTWNTTSPYSNLSCDLYINSILNQSFNCSRNVNTFDVFLNDGKYNWTIDVTDTDNLSDRTDEENFINILRVNKKVTKTLINSGKNIYTINTQIQNNINRSDTSTLYEFVDIFFVDSLLPSYYDISSVISGVLNGTLYKWNDNIISPLSQKNYTYSITPNSNSSQLIDNYVVGIE